MILRTPISYSLARLAARLTCCLVYLRSNCQIFVVEACSPIVHFYRPIFPLTDQCFGFRRPIAPVLRLELQKLTPRY